MRAESLPPHRPEPSGASQRLWVSLLVLGAFVVARYALLLRLVAQATGEAASAWPRPLVVAAFYASWLVPVLVVTAALEGWRWRPLPGALGLTANAGRGLMLALAATLPMLVGYAFLAGGTARVSAPIVVSGALLPGFMEELLFRGFLFGLLFRRARWGFVPAVAVNALAFAAGHLYQTAELGASLAVFLITLLGGAWFAWLYVEWDECLWLPIGLHVLMNLWWLVFSVGDTAIGGLTANVFRAATIAVTVVATIRRRRRLGRFRLTPRVLFVNVGPPSAATGGAPVT